jgi:hypothetical protein
VTSRQAKSLSDIKLTHHHANVRQYHHGSGWVALRSLFVLLQNILHGQVSRSSTAILILCAVFFSAPDGDLSAAQAQRAEPGAVSDGC